MLGGMVSIGAFYTLAIIISPILQHLYTAQGIPVEKLYDQLVTSPGALSIWHLLTIMGFGIGGYFAASNASVKPLLSAALSAGVMLLILLVQYMGVYPNPYPFWSQVLGFITPIPSALLGGGYLYAKGQSSDGAQPSDARASDRGLRRTVARR
jgi:hypothetical protein